MFEQRASIQSLLCRARGLSRYCSTSGFGPHPPSVGFRRKTRFSNVRTRRAENKVFIVYVSSESSAERRRPRHTHFFRETASLEQSATKDNSQVAKSNSYLPDEGLHRDHAGGGPRARPDHCTSAGLTPAIIPNVDNSVV